MEILYKWLLKDYSWEYFWWLSIIKDIFHIEDWFTQKIDWKYSEKKKKFYSKIDYKDNRWRFEFIIFKNWYCILWFTKIYKAQEWDLSF